MPDIEKLRQLLSESHAEFVDGYTSEDVDRVLGALSAAGGVRLVVVWAYVDQWGTGGNSEIVGHDGQQWRSVSSELVRHLHGDSPASDVLDQLVDGADVTSLLLSGPVPVHEQASIDAGATVGVSNVALDTYDGQAPKWA